jgi:hypothetical protein
MPHCVQSSPNPATSALLPLGADERATAAYEFIEPRGWEFYGKPSDQAMETMRATAARTGVSLVVEPEFNAGFLRLQPP